MATTDVLWAELQKLNGAPTDPQAAPPLDTSFFDLGVDSEMLKTFIEVVNAKCLAMGKDFELTMDLCLAEPTLGAIAAAIDARASSKVKTYSKTSRGAFSASRFSPAKAVLLLLLGAISSASAQTAGPCNSTAPVRATGFTVTYTGSYRILTVPGCSNAQYVLYDRGTTAPSLGNSYLYFAVPLQSAVATTTISLTFTELLGVHGTLTALSQYSTSACAQKLVADVSIACPRCQMASGEGSS
jgi:hypothetical protein